MGSIYTMTENSTPTDEESSAYETDEGEEFSNSEHVSLHKNDAPLDASDSLSITLNKKLDKVENNLKTDAVENKPECGYVHYPSATTITVKTVENIERNLDFYEKVSLVFLLYDNADIALQGLLKEQSYQLSELNISANLISEWARSKHVTGCWQEKLLEAICIIQNYSILQDLGFDKNEVNERFLPFNPSSVLSVDIIRKALYRICEDFNKEDTNKFLQFLRRDFRHKYLQFQEFDERYLEMYFLYCFSMKYIQSNDLKNILKVFKTMKLDHIYDMLESVMIVKNRSINVDNMEEVKLVEEFSNKTVGNHKEIISNQKISNDYISDNVNIQFKLNLETENSNLDHDIKRCSDNSVIGDNSIVSTRSFYSSDECYYVNPHHVGVCLIINQKTFYKDKDINLLCLLPTSQDLQQRNGTNVDRDKLVETFSAFGFQIIIHEDLTHEQLKTEIKNVAEKITKKDSCFFICILSHGYADHVYGVNSIPVPISDLEDILHDKKYVNLLGKPKILIIQSCQGSALQQVVHYDDDFNTTDGPNMLKGPHRDVHSLITDGLKESPERSDLLVCSSTIPGYASIRHEKTGSWYIQELCKVLQEEGYRKHFADILTTVNRNVSSRRWKKNGTNVCMVSECKSSFLKVLYLPEINQAGSSYNN